VILEVVRGVIAERLTTAEDGKLLRLWDQSGTRTVLGESLGL
jgi:hypothetical protein